MAKGGFLCPTYKFSMMYHDGSEKEIKKEKRGRSKMDNDHDW